MSVSRSLRREFAASDEVVFRSPGDIARKLREVGVRPTNQRVALVSILVRESGHTTAKGLHETAVKSRIAVSLATVYNTLHHLTKHRLLRPTSVDNSTVFYEINSSQHHHFFVEDRNGLVDIPPSAMRLKRLPVPPQAFSVSGVEVLVKLRRKEIKIAATAEGR